MTTLAAPQASEADLPPASTGHPRGLYVLFGSEMWERFSYYGMRALLVLYLTKHLNFARSDALALYATYTGLVYLTPLLGGFLADKVLGQRKAILIGGIVMAMGHFAMAFEDRLYLALSLLILGNGFFKPNISTMVGNLYPQNDPRRDGAYTIFYVGINLGAFFAPLVCGALGESEQFGWHYGFAAAGVGMVLGLISFLSFQKLLSGGYPPDREASGATRLTALDGLHVVGGSLVCLATAYAIGQAWPTFQPHIRYLVPAIIAVYALALIYVFSRVAAKSGTEAVADWQRLAVILIVGLFSMVFWTGFEQAGGTLNLFADSKTDRTLYGALNKPFAASLLQAVNPFFIFTLAPLFSVFWSRLDQTRFRITSSAKMGLGLISLGIGFSVMVGAEAMSASGKLIGPEWLVGFYFFATVGEICLSPIGLSLVNKLAPPKIASLMMAVWFLCNAVANYMAGILEHELEAYKINLFLFLVAISIVSGLTLIALTVPLKRMSRGRL